MAYWLVKSEAEVFSIDDFAREKTTAWTDVRNYQARNYLREMLRGDTVLFYHSNSEPTGIVGLGKVVKTAYPDPTQFDPKSDYYDAKASKDAPRWFCPDLQFVKKFSRILELSELKKEATLKSLPLLQRGSRLSVIPVNEKEFTTIIGMSLRQPQTSLPTNPRKKHSPPRPRAQ